MNIFNSIGHLFAWVISKALPAAAGAVAKADAEISSPLADAIAALAGTKAAAVQAGIQAIAGDVLNAFGAAGEAIGEGGLNVQFDTNTVTAIKTIYTELRTLFGKATSAPTAPAAAAPAAK